MSQSTLHKELSEINAMAKVLQEKSQRLMAKLGSENGSSPALRKGLTVEQKLKVRERRTRIINR